jgi:DNA-binding CsgD family transcriptional regulator
MGNVEAAFDPTSAQSLAQLKQLARGFARSLECDHFSYFLTRLPRGQVPAEDTFLADYPDEWQARYKQRSYKFYDPVVTISRTSRLPFYWGERGFLQPYSKAERHVFHEANEYGILEGYGIPTAGPEADSGIFSVIVRHRNLIHEMVAEEAARLQLFAAQFHDAAVRLIAQDNHRNPAELTKREKEVLNWTAEGFSSEAVAARMGLSASAVNYHITNACRKIGASNKIQAVALAIRHNLL